MIKMKKMLVVEVMRREAMRTYEFGGQTK